MPHNGGVENTTTIISLEQVMAAYSACPSQAQRQQALSAALAMLRHPVVPSSGPNPIGTNFPLPTPTPDGPTAHFGAGANEPTEDLKCQHGIPLAVRLPKAGTKCEYLNAARGSIYKLARKGELFLLRSEGFKCTSVYGPSICEFRYGGCTCGYRHELEHRRQEWQAEQQAASALKAAVEKKAGK
jgi:hypothetical protein